MKVEQQSLEQGFQQAVDLFHQEQYKASFLQFVALYENGFQPDTVLDLLIQCFYEPNAQLLEENYQKNVEILQAYPYCWDTDFPAFQDLDFLLFPVCDGVYYKFDEAALQFTDLYETASEEIPPYFFKLLDKPLLLENITDPQHLAYLRDTVRRSEDYAGDNHIYLYYSDPALLYMLMLATELAPLLASEKFIFLIGAENRARYPINFKKQFGIDYKAMPPQPLRIEELTRFCLWYKHAYSGTDLSMGVFRKNKNLIVVSAHDFHAYSAVNGKPMCYTDEFKSALGDVNRAYSLAAIEKICHTPGNDIRLPDLDAFLHWLRDSYPEQDLFTVAFLFRSYFLFLYQKENGTRRSRIAPTIVFDPHIWDTSIYNALVQSFPHYTVLTSVREPIVTFARSYQYGLVVWNQFQTKYILASDYAHTQFLNEEMKHRYYGFRFEDLKQLPEKTCRQICRHFNVPFSPAMLSADVPAMDKSGSVVRGFDPTPLHRKIDAVFSEFDRLRLQIFFEPIHKYYGYPAFDSQEYPLTEAEIRQLFSHPFRFERHYREIYQQAPAEAELHEWIQEVLSMRLSDEAVQNIVFPKLISQEE